MGSGVSSNDRIRGMKSVNTLKALQRLSHGMSQQHQQQQHISHQAVNPFINNRIPKQRIGLEFTQGQTKMSLKQTTMDGISAKPSTTTTAQPSTTAKPEVKDSKPNEADDTASRNEAAALATEPTSKKEEDESAQAEDSPKKSKPTKVKVYSEEESEAEKKEYLDKLMRVLEKFCVEPTRDLEEEGEPYPKSCRNHLLVFAKSYFHFKLGQVPYPFIYQFRQAIAKTFLDCKAIDKLCEIFKVGLERRQFFKEDGKMNILFWLPLKNCMLTLLNYSDVSDDVKLAVGTHPTLFAAIVKLLNEWRNDHLEGNLSEDKTKCLKWCLSVCHNVASMEENIPMMRENGVIQAVLPYLESTVSTLRLTAVATLADVVNDEEAELLQTHVAVFKFIIKVLKSSLSTENHKHLGWSAEELTKAIRQLGRNDANKKILVDEGCLPLLVELIDTGDEDEVNEAINTLWVLSFKPENKMKMVQEEGLIHCLEQKFTAAGDGSLRHACHGVLWSLRDQINSPDSPVKVGEAVNSMMTKPSPTQASDVSKSKFKGHIMLSYQWGNQELIKRIVQEMRSRDIPVWLDIDYMGGSTLQAMAQAVEDSAAVVIAMSQKYKDSPNTRAEAEYAFQLRKKIIPLIMQRDYQPDGWLGFILGSKLYYDFSGKHSFESRMEGLLKAVLEVKDGAITVAVEMPTVAAKKDQSFAVAPVLPPVGKSPAVSRSLVEPSSNFDLEAIKKWTADDKTKWLTKHGIKEYKTLSSLEGEEIAFLHNVKLEAPEFFYRCVEKKLGYSSLADLAKVTSALSDLSL